MIKCDVINCNKTATHLDFVDTSKGKFYFCKKHFEDWIDHKKLHVEITLESMDIIHEQGKSK